MPEVAVLSKLRFLALALALTACSTAPSAASAQALAGRLIGPCGSALGFGNLKWSRDGARIAFDEYVGGDVQVAVMDASGDHLQQLTNLPGFNGLGGWTPASGAAGDAGRIIFMSNRDGPYHIYLMGADGRSPARLTTGSDASVPSVSPDGTQIVFSSFYLPRRGAIYRLDLDGAKLTRLSEPESDDYLPAWSPDGRRIAYIAIRGGLPQLYVMDRDGVDPHPVGDLTASNNPPVWSPDGRWIAFLSSRMAGGALTTSLDVAASDGSAERQLALTPADTLFYWPSWSPDSRHMAFVTSGTAGEDISLIAPDGSGQAALTTTPGSDYSPAWSPDGRSIAFVSARDGAPEIYRMDADGSHPARLTTNPANQKCLRWPF